ncbi:MAG: class I SAM-dependent methyltransferase [Actinobacteria bacterium]|nr:class I SAM-dependent methyltransferase [Actinomycetota bacterium]MBU1609348.1 class I SAM-dependent methyltransferase [Actinomycetota bacterium]MBU2314980.1 class I SAM-dependent methyltransferase [Actinomycetota bacterium]MBU2385054.1 class I SAM-dependent methyltransferase [Actinomycetota bacterium]
MIRRKLQLLAIGGLTALIVAATLAAVGALADSAILAGVSTALASFALAVLFGVVFVLLRRLSAAVSRPARAGADGLAGRETQREVAELRSAIREVRRQVSEVQGTLRPGPGGLRSALRHEVLRDTAALLTLHDMLPVTAEHVPLTSYSALPDTALMLAQQVRELPSGSTVVEVGCGATTLWLALAVQQRGGDVRIVSLEGSADYAEVTRLALERNGVATHVDVRVAALVATETRLGMQQWYDPARWSDLCDIDLLFVDGPAGGTGPMARFPVMELLSDRLAPGARIVVDDVHRDDEQELVKAWCERTVGCEQPREVERRERTVLLRLS